jgi:hypothetical protein
MEHGQPVCLAAQGTHIHIVHVICSQSLMHNVTLQRTDEVDRLQRNYSYVQLTYLSYSLLPCFHFDQYGNIPISLPESSTTIAEEGRAPPTQLSSSPHDICHLTT